MSVDGEICARERVEGSRISDSVLPEIFGISFRVSSGRLFLVILPTIVRHLHGPRLCKYNPQQLGGKKEIHCSPSGYHRLHFSLRSRL